MWNGWCSDAAGHYFVGMELILENWAVLALAILGALDVFVSLTPSKTDDRVVGYLRVIITTISGKSKNKKDN